MAARTIRLFSRLTPEAVRALDDLAHEYRTTRSALVAAAVARLLAEAAAQKDRP